MWCIYMKIHVPSMLVLGVEMINNQTQQTKGLEYIEAATLA